MVIRSLRFNLYLLLLAAVLGAGGCQSAKSKQEKETATLRIHLEANPLQAAPTEQIPVLRSAPMFLSIERAPFLNESHIASATLLERSSGFALQIQFNQQGTRLLEQYTAANARRRYAIRCQFRQTTNAFDRWLAAPLITHRVANGILSFTPDADRTEAEAIVSGWNRVAATTQPKKKSEAEKKSAEPK